jgi:hypothetical protein
MRSFLVVALTLIVALFPACTEAKFQSGSITIGGDIDEFKWRYLSKFGYFVGTGTWAVRFKTLRPSLPQDAKVTADVFLDLEWGKAENEPNVCERHKYRRASGTVNVPANGEWSEWIKGNLSQSARAYIWYVVATDCGNNFASPTRLKFEFVAKQENGDHFSVEMLGCYWIALVELLFFVYICYNIFIECKKTLRSEQAIHPVTVTLISMVGLHVLSVLCQFIHFHVYSNDGEGLKALDVIAELLNMLSQVIGSSLLILIALGYTLLHSKLGNLDVVIPIVFIVGVLHVLLVGFGKIKDDASFKFYENEGVIGWILLVLRIILLAWFVWAVKETSRESPGIKLGNFLAKFLAAGVAYFLSYPVTFIITALFPAYMRYKVMMIGNFIMKLGSYMWMARLFLTRGEYFEVSTLKSSFLPGGLMTGVTKEE